MYKISNAIDWRHARKIIKEAIVVGLDLNNTVYPNAIVTEIDNYGFTIRIEGMRNIKVKWFLLEHCWKTLYKDGIHGQDEYCNLFGQEFIDVDSLDFLITRIFKRSGILEPEKTDQLQIQF